MRESRLLEHVYRSAESLGERVIIPPGDDMALVRVRSGAGGLLLAVDQVVDGRHVRLDSTPLALIGRKAMTRCLSDVAAMAARPLVSLASVTFPRGFGEARACELFDAMQETAVRYDAPLVGGDVAIHDRASGPLVISVTLTAEPAATAPVRRSGACPGDGLFVTGVLGATIDPDGLGHHLSFEPRIEAALELAGALGDRLHAMIDLSDGLGRDVPNLCAASRVSIEVDAAELPCRAGAAWRDALDDGEDYELCFAATGAVPDRLGDLPVTRIGRVLAAGGQPVATLRRDGRVRPWGDWGWEHRDGEQCSTARSD
jgi:thiamine-monophosphate kinase